MAFTLAACSVAPATVQPTGPSGAMAVSGDDHVASGAGTVRLQLAWPTRGVLAIPDATSDIHIVVEGAGGQELAELSVVKGTSQAQLPQSGQPRLPAGPVTIKAEARDVNDRVLARAQAPVTIAEDGPTTVQLTFNPVHSGGGGSSAVATPTVSSLSPTSGTSAGGTSVTITGTNLTGATAVSFGGTPATSFTVDSATQLTAVAPAHAAGAVDVAVTTPGGTATDAGAYTYVAAPTISSLSPTSGSTAGGTSVTITGTNLTGATAVSFGGTPATSFTVDSATQLTAVAPAHAAGAADVAVTTAGGTFTAAAAYTYTVAVAAPVVSMLSPTSGSTAGGTSVTITGTDLTGATAVTFDGMPATSFTVDSATQLTAVAPAHAAGAVDVAVITPGGTDTATGAYTYTMGMAPSITSVSPGVYAVMAPVTISGSGFTGATSVMFGSVAADSFTVGDDNTITAFPPSQTTGTVDVTVTTPSGSDTSVGAFFYP